MDKTVGIIGNGFVGNAIYKNFKSRVTTKVFDIIKEKTINSYDEVIVSDYIFVCLPTPMSDDGSCNTSYVFDFFSNVPKDIKGLFVLKSTVPIGITDKIKSLRKDLNIVHNPEFLTATNAERDFHMCDRNVIGGNNKDSENLRDFLYSIFGEWKSVPCFLVSPKQSELIKYFSNCFLALKVAYFNNVFESCEKFGVTFDVVKDAISHDPRIGKSHTQVPGPDGHLGFGGYCFPKDINALIKTMNENQIDSGILESAWGYNLKLRGNIQ
jgi:UDPglucose 6-dehydrogenase